VDCRSPVTHAILRDVKTTVDTLLDGKVALEQPAPGHGYRFNEDSVLIAQLAAQGRSRVHHLVDLGAGVGAIALCVARLTSVEKLTLVEHDAEACALARANAQRAGARATVIESSVEALGAIEPADVVVINPPYSAPRAGRASAVPERDRARRGPLEPFIHAASRVLATGGRGYVSMPAGSTVALLQAIENARLCARRGAFVFSSAERPARIVIVEFAHEAGDFVVLTLGGC
jgi:tRNA1(Val) A37 N6-methylase TrmN6